MNASTDYSAGWYADTMVAAPERPRLSIDLDVDVCVIGAGLAGLTAAREIARRGWSVVVLEGGRIGWAASGRNTGFVLPGFNEEIDRIVERIGEEHARKLWGLSEQGLAYVRRTIEETAMPGVDPVPGWLYVAKTDDRSAMLSHTAQMQKLGADVEFWPTRRVRSVLPSKRYFDAIHYPNAFHIHPLNYALGLAAAAESAGVRIYEQTPAVTIDPAGVRKRITTPTGLVRAPHVVLAGNVHLGSLMPRLAATLMPVTTYVMVTEPLGDKLAETISYRGAVSDTDWADNHYRIVGGDRLMWSGRMTTWSGNEKMFARGLTRDIARNFPQLGRPKVAHVWRGTLGIPVHRMPQIGELYRGVWVASGFGGHGLNTTAMAGQLVADGITAGGQDWRLFAPYELVWAGGTAGRTAMQALYWFTRPVERVRQGFARRRERIRRARKSKSATRLAAARLREQLKAPIEARPVAQKPSEPVVSSIPPSSSSPSAPKPKRAGKNPGNQRIKKPKPQQGRPSNER